MAEVPDAADPATELNLAFLDSLAPAEQIYIAGEAGSHCVKASVEHIAGHFAERFGEAALARLALLTDCISPVAGFEPQYHDFLAAMQARGVQLVQSGEVLQELLRNAGR
ncbi:hypothetical protein [Rugamonas sp. DEMB1]|nr:hypothetical protein [Rugamonas sp. DEMB1]